MSAPLQGPPAPSLPLLLGIGGFGAEVLSRFRTEAMGEILSLDTDRRTGKRFPNVPFKLIGEPIVKGEGCGGNMNLGRACFRASLEELSMLVMNRPLVLMVCSVEGSTGVAGAVELSTLLRKAGLMFFNVLVLRGSVPSGGAGPRHMASLLLEGPLSPGAFVDLSQKEQPKGMKGISDIGSLAAALGTILQCSSRSSVIPVPDLAWLKLREDKGPYAISILSGLDPESWKVGDQKEPVRTPAMMLISIPREMSVDEVRALISKTSQRVEGADIGLSPRADGGDPVEVLLIMKRPIDLGSGDLGGAGASETPPQKMELPGDDILSPNGPRP